MGGGNGGGGGVGNSTASIAWRSAGLQLTHECAHILWHGISETAPARHRDAWMADFGHQVDAMVGGMQTLH